MAIQQQAKVTYTLTVENPLTINPFVPVVGVQGQPYSQQLSASGGNLPYTWSASGLPAGLSIDPNTGLISGTPTTAGLVNVTVSVTDTAL